jgi:cytochrome d ubiquinol oxidase subunit II
MELPEILAAVMLVALVLYAALGGADFGGGVWDLLALGRRAREQRALVEEAIAPVWEANHVWLILVIVLLFTAFPAAFALASIHLHIPLTLMLIGIVLRGSAFVFRKYDSPAHGQGGHGDPSQSRWGHVFAAGSIVSPFFLGVSLGAVTAGRIGAGEGGFWARFVWPWLHAFPSLVGLFALVLFACLAAIYLAVEAGEAALAGDFRARALSSGAAVPVVAALTALAAGAPVDGSLGAGLFGSAWGLLALAAAALAWLGAMLALAARRFRLARAAGIALVTAILGGWAAGQYPFLVRPQLTVWNAAAPPITLRLLLLALGAGALLLFPSLFWLLHVFKRRPAFAPLDDDEGAVGPPSSPRK